MRRSGIVIAAVCLACFFTLFLGRFALADVSPGDVIDKSNYQKVEGMIAPSIVNWLKNGDMVIKIGKLNFDINEVNDSLLGGKQAREANIGKYALKDDLIVDAKTGAPPDFVQGIPFPNLDMKDPQLGIKFMYNRDFLRHAEGNVDIPCAFQFITPKGFEREATLWYYQWPFEGYPAKKDLPNPDGLQRYNLYVFRTPFDIAGTSLMSWRYKDKREDLNFAYVPSIRRVRRLTPANRSDSIIGSEICWDDAFGYDAKPSFWEWKVLKVGDFILPYLSEDPQPLVKDPEMGGWMTTKELKKVDYGYQKPEWQGAKWAPLNLVWVKRPVIVVEARCKDPYYNFGSQTIYFDAETPHAFVRDINDRSGAYWKTMITSSGALRSASGEKALMSFTTMQTMNVRTNNCTIVEVLSPRNIWHYFTNSDANKFSLSGYAAFCK
ncbi:MAG: DUF1329 domain-containing protein [Syntrophobacteraceae bacterium]